MLWYMLVEHMSKFVLNSKKEKLFGKFFGVFNMATVINFPINKLTCTFSSFLSTYNAFSIAFENCKNLLEPKKCKVFVFVCCYLLWTSVVVTVRSF